VDLVDVGGAEAVDPAVRVHWGGSPRAELLTLTEARELAQILVGLAYRAEAG
jgi:hypothetical protein